MLFKNSRSKRQQGTISLSRKSGHNIIANGRILHKGHFKKRNKQKDRFFTEKISFSKYLYVSLQIENNQKNHIAMAEKIKYVGLVLLVIGAIILLASQINGWNNINGVNFGATAAMIVGLITYVVAGKKGYQQ